MRDFVTLGGNDTHLGFEVCTLRVHQIGAGPAGDETPIFHSTCVKVTSLE